MTATAALLVAVDMLVFSTTLGTMRCDLHASSPSLLGWTANAYILNFAVL